MNALDLIASHLARPLTHRVKTVFEGVLMHRHDTHSAAQTENWATGERRKIGRTLINRETGDTVKVLAITIDLI